MKKYLALIFIFLSGCAGDEVHQSSFNVNNVTREVDAQGWYHLAGFYFKGKLEGGNPHGKGKCRSYYESFGKTYWSESSDSPCEFNHGVRIDQQYVQKINDENADRSASAAQAQREHNQQEDKRRAEQRAWEKEQAQANRESDRKWQQDQHKLDAVFAESNRQVAEISERGAKQRQQQIQNDKAESDAAWAQGQRARSSSTPNSGNATYVASSNGSVSSQSAGRSASSNSNSSNTRDSSATPKVSAKKEAVEIQTITVESGSDKDMCFSRETAEKQARFGASNKAHEDCYGLGKGWSFDKEKFAGYLGCTPCTGGEAGNFKCRITQAMYNCKH